MNNNVGLQKGRAGARHTGWVKHHNLNRPNDVDLAKAAADAIECLTTVPLEGIRVTAHKGLLHLEGTVPWNHQRVTLEDVVWHLPGVHGVVDSIMVKASG